MSADANAMSPDDAPVSRSAQTIDPTAAAIPTYTAPTAPTDTTNASVAATNRSTRYRPSRRTAIPTDAGTAMVAASRTAPVTTVSPVSGSSTRHTARATGMRVAASATHSSWARVTSSAPRANRDAVAASRQPNDAITNVPVKAFPAAPPNQVGAKSGGRRPVAA